MLQQLEAINTKARVPKAYQLDNHNKPIELDTDPMEVPIELQRPIKRNLLSFEFEDPLESIDLGAEGVLRLTKISGLLMDKEKKSITCLLHQYKDCFAWHYHEIHRLARELIEYRLPIKEG